jgi:hypothetical protein
MVRRRSTVRFRNGAPGSRYYSILISSSDSKIKRLAIGSAAPAGSRYSVTYLETRALWPAVIRLNSLWRVGYAAFGRCASPCNGESVRLVRSRWIGLAETKVLGRSEDVRLRLSSPGAIVTWLVTGSWGRSDRLGWAHLARLLVGRCLGTARACYRASPGAPWPVIRRGSRWAGPLPEPRRAGACRKSRTRSVMSGSAGPCQDEWHPGCAPSAG